MLVQIDRIPADLFPLGENHVGIAVTVQISARYPKRSGVIAEDRAK